MMRNQGVSAPAVNQQYTLTRRTNQEPGDDEHQDQTKEHSAEDAWGKSAFGGLLITFRQAFDNLHTESIPLRENSRN